MYDYVYEFKPSADENVRSVDENVLLVNKYFHTGKDYVIGSLVVFWIGVYLSIVISDFTMTLLFGTIALGNFLIVWVSDTPIVFNRSTKKVSAWFLRGLFEGEWDIVKNSFIGTLRQPTSYGYSNERILFFRISSVWNEQNFARIMVADIDASRDCPLLPLEIERYIIAFMERGSDAVNRPISQYRLLSATSIKDLLYRYQRLYRELLETKPHILVWVRVPFSIMSTVMIYIPCLIIDKIVPRLSIPPVLQEAINARA